MSASLFNEFLAISGLNEQKLFAKRLAEKMAEECGNEYDLIVTTLDVADCDDDFEKLFALQTDLENEVTNAKTEACLDVDDKHGGDVSDEYADLVDKKLCVIALGCYIMFLKTSDVKYVEKMAKISPIDHTTQYGLHADLMGVFSHS